VANTSNPFGFRQFGSREGSAPTAGMDRMFVSSGQTIPIFTGDVVINSTTLPYVISGGSTAAIATVMQGVFIGCKYYNTSLNRTIVNSYWPGSGATGDVEAYVCTNPEQLYLVQGSTGGVLGTSCIGLGAPMSVTNSSLGNTTTGQSVMTLQSSLVTGVSSNAQFKIVDIYSNVAPPGTNGTSTGAEGWQIVVVQPLNSARRTLQGALSGATMFTT